MSRRSWRVVVAALGLALVLAVAPSAARAQEEGKKPIPVKELPAVVAEAAKKLCPDGEITSAKKEWDLDAQGKVEEFDYDMKVTLKSGKVHDVAVDTTPEGKVKPGECEARGPVAAEDLPKAVLDAAKRLCPEGQLASGERRARFRGDQVEAEYRLKLGLPGDKAAEVRLRLTADEQVRDTRLDAPVAAKEVPKLVGDVLQLICPGGEVTSARKQTQAEGDRVRVGYELKLKMPDGKAFRASVRVADDGRIRRMEVQEQ